MYKRLFISIPIMFCCCFQTLHAQQLVTKEAYLKKVSENAHQIKLAFEDTRLAKANTQEIRSAIFPKISSSLGYQRNIIKPQVFFEFPVTDPTTGEPTGENEFQGFDANLNNDFQFLTSLQQTIFNIKAIQGIQAGKLYKEIAEEQYQATKKKVLAEAEKLYLQTAILEKVYEVDIEEEKAALKNYRRAKVNQQSGLISDLDFAQSELRYDNSITNKLNSKANLQYAKTALKKLAGVDINTHILIDTSLVVKDNTKPLQSLSLESTLNNRNDYQAQLKNIALQKKQTQINRSGLYPSIAGVLQYSYSVQSDEFRLDQNINKALFAGIQLQWDVFTGGQRSATVQKSKIEQKKAQLQAEDIKFEIQSQIQQKQMQLEIQRKKVTVAEKTKTTSAKALRLAQINASSGLISQKELKETAIENRKAQLAHLNALVTLHQLRIDIKIITGTYDE